MTIHSEPEATCDQVWRTLKSEASDMAEREPLLAPLLNRILLMQDTFQEALAHYLAAGLASQDVTTKSVQLVLSRVLGADPKILNSTAQDLIAIQARDPACRNLVHAFSNYKGFHAVQTHRMSHALWRAERRELAAWLANRASVTFGPDIHPAARLGSGIMLDHGSGIVIGETAVVDDDVTILQNVTLGGTGKTKGDRHPKLRQGVMIGAGTNILGNIEIGAFSKVGAGSVVLKDVPPRCSVAGVPAQIIRLHQVQKNWADRSERSQYC